MRLKSFLSNVISTKQFVFLGGRFIHKTVGIVQEVLHSIKRKKQSTIVIKNNISKYYDHTCWIYLRLLLTNISFHMIQSISFTILINWSTSSFFISCRGSIKVSHLPLVSSYWSHKALVSPLSHQKEMGTLSTFNNEAQNMFEIILLRTMSYIFLMV